MDEHRESKGQDQGGEHRQLSPPTSEDSFCLRGAHTLHWQVMSPINSSHCAVAATGTQDRKEDKQRTQGKFQGEPTTADWAAARALSWWRGRLDSPSRDLPVEQKVR